MKWKYQDSKCIFRIDDDYRMIHGVVKDRNVLAVNRYVVEELEKIFGFQLIGNVEIVAKIVGVRIPPNVWCKVLGKSKNQR